MNEKVNNDVAIEKSLVTVQLKAYIANNPIAVITAVGSFIGGLLILVYLVSIQYFPSNMDISTVGFLLAGSAITGTFLTFWLALYLVFPGFVYRHVLNSQSAEGQDQEAASQIDFLNLSSVVWLLDIPAAIVFVFAIIQFLFGWSGFLWPIFLIGSTPLFILLVYRFCINENSKIYAKINYIYELSKQSILKCIGYIGVSVFTTFIPWFFILILISQYAKETSDEVLVWFVFVVMCFCSIFVNHLIATAKKWWFQAIAVPAMLLVFFVITEQISFIPKVVVHTLTFGNMQNVTLMLDEQGCQIASQHVRLPRDLVAIINPISPTSNKENKSQDKQGESSIVCRLSPVNLKWRIGNEYFVDATDANLYPVIGKKFADDDKKIKNGNSLKQVEKVSVRPQSVSVEFPLLPTTGFTIASAHVLSWSMGEQKKPVTQ